MKKLVLSLSLLFAGTFVFAQQKQMPHKMDPSDRKEMMEKRRTARFEEMQKDLNLSADQVTRIRAVQEKYQQQREAQRINQNQPKQKWEGVKKDRQMMDDEIRSILTPEQYQKWQANRQSKRAPHNRMKMHKTK